MTGDRFSKEQHSGERKDHGITVGTVSEGKVIINLAAFASSEVWMTPDVARSLAKSLIHHAAEAEYRQAHDGNFPE